MLEDGGVEERVRLVRPAARETMARAELDASTWREADEEQWRALWEAEIGGLPSHTESRFWLVTGLLLPIWDRVPDRNMRVRRLTADSGEHMIGRVLGPAEAVEFRNALGLAGGPGLTPAELFGEIMDRGAAFPLATGGEPRMAARAPKPDGRSPAGDRGTGRRRCRHPQAHGLRNRDRLLAHPRVRARCGRARTRHRALSARSQPV